MRRREERAWADWARVVRSAEVPTEGWEVEVGAGRALREAMEEMTALVV